MKSTTPPSVRQMIYEAVEALGSPTTNVAVRRWIEARYPDTVPGTIRAQTTICTVNHPSRFSMHRIGAGPRSHCPSSAPRATW